MNKSETSQVNIIFVDDEIEILNALKRLTARHLDAHCEFVESGQAALEQMEHTTFDLIVSDMRMPKMNGSQLLATVAELYPDTMRMILTGYSEKDDIINAINQGRIWGYINKPWDNDDLIQSIQQALTTAQMIAERALLRRSLEFYEKDHKNGFADFIGRSMPMQLLYNGIERAAPSNASIFITGPSGTGKELAALAVHQFSHRKDKPFIALNCAAIPHDLMESEIFGHVKGAFSGAISNREGAASQADGGTLFLDELAEMDISLQAKLLRFIQTGMIQKVGAQKSEHVDIRFVCATNRSPLEAIDKGTLREDLFYRLNVVPLTMPALNQRGTDAILIANYFLEQFCQQENKVFVGFSNNAEKFINEYAWPGNVRQLENAVHSMVVMNDGPLLTYEHLAFALQLAPNETIPVVKALDELKPTLDKAPEALESQSPRFVSSLANVERIAIEQAIDICAGNVVQAASKLEVSPSTLYRKMQQWQE